ncbi:MAG: hypothetical protein DRO01_05220 [Thermoproteota archaeon]|nr:MAG: hypothetical protein DRO01_05220 [Candidatus Korarchaeota archaeon]
MQGATKVKTPVQKRPKSGRKIQVVSTGAKKLDEIISGGFPIKSNVLIYGPPFVGKESFLYQFIAEGLKWGVPSLVVLTRYTTTTARKNLIRFYPKLKEREKEGLVRYIDAYSKSVGMIGNNPYAKYISGPGALQEIARAIEEFQRSLQGRFYYHRIILDSLTPMLRQKGLDRLMNFLHAVVARNKTYRGVACYDISAGIHSEGEVSAIESVMDGTISFREDGKRFYLKIKGLRGVKNRDWLEYNFDDTSLDILGIFGLDYIP